MLQKVNCWYIMEKVCPEGKVKIESAGESGIKTTINDGLGDYGMKMSY